LVAVKIEIPELGELTDRLGQRAQFETRQIQQRRTVFPRFLDPAEDFCHRVFRRPLKGPFRHRSNVRDITGVQDAVSIFKCRFLAGVLKRKGMRMTIHPFRHSKGSRWARSGNQSFFYPFDLLWLNGKPPRNLAIDLRILHRDWVPAE
jgi:hypothetical protein